MCQPLTREEFEQASDEIHLEIGRAISEWSVVEQWIFDIFARLVSRGPSAFGLSTAFEDVRSFETKLQMITSLVTYSGHPAKTANQQLSDWKPIRKKLKTLNEKRNSIAHGSIISPKRVIAGPPVARPVWIPYYESKGYHVFKLASHLTAKPFKELAAADIAGIRQSFLDVQHTLAEFYRVHLR